MVELQKASSYAGWRVLYRRAKQHSDSTGFITMEDGDHTDGDGFPVQEYTVHILPAIYPDKDLSRNEASKDMKNKNYEAWVKTYEEFYKKPLEYGEKWSFI